MSTNNKRVLTGKHFIMGDHAIAEGALAAGLNFFGGYPITPASPIAERVSWRVNEIENAEFIQMEDEIASMASILGASAAGAKSMTATSGPGLSLMLENLGLGYMMEIPTVVVNVMRGGPSTGMPTLTSQGDIMQAKWGSHGDFQSIAYVPANVQEMFDLTIKSFNAAEKYRTPVIILADQITGLMTGELNIPPEDELEIVNRKIPPEGLDHYLPYDSSELVPPMAIAGQGYRVHMTGLTHDDRGYPAATPDHQAKLMDRLDRKFKAALELVEVEEKYMEDADLAVLCYGTEGRSVIEAVNKARSKGMKVGMYRLKTLWPFHYEMINKLSNQVKKILVPEGNMGQYVHPVTEAADCPVISLPQFGGKIHTPTEIYEKIEEIMK